MAGLTRNVQLIAFLIVFISGVLICTCKLINVNVVLLSLLKSHWYLSDPNKTTRGLIIRTLQHCLVACFAHSSMFTVIGTLIYFCRMHTNDKVSKTQGLLCLACFNTQVQKCSLATTRIISLHASLPAS